jgi:catechol 2,3-dioxygenase-like lactoylglutathione lyase family enzyme
MVISPIFYEGVLQQPCVLRYAKPDRRRVIPWSTRKIFFAKAGIKSEKTQTSLREARCTEITRSLSVMSEQPAGLFRGLFETHLHVADLERSMRFYGEVLGLELGRKETERRAALYWVGKDRRTMLGLWENPPWVMSDSATRDSFAGDVGNVIRAQHLAFEIALEDLQTAIDRIKQHGIEPRDFFDRVTDEPSVFGWMPAASIYFNDVDGHLLEFIARLEGDPAPDLGIVSLTEWKQFSRR